MGNKNYTIVVPALDRTGPVNVACDLGRAAAARGWRVRLLTLSDKASRNDLHFAAEVRRWRLSDLWQLNGVVHTHCLRPDLLGAMFALNRRCLLVTTLHNFFLIDTGFNYSPKVTWLAWQVWRRALTRYDHVVCISEAMRRYYRRILPDQAFELARNFRAESKLTGELSVEHAGWLAAQRLQNRHVLIYVGGLNRRKNIGSLFAALTQRPDCALLICGAGPQRAELEQQASESGIGARVLFAGQVSDPRLAIAKSDMLVLPSFAEGFPLVVLEAASVGVPSLLSNIAVHRELSALGFGYTFDHRQGREFSEKVNAILTKLPAPNDSIRTLWADKYSNEPGFARYEKLFISSPDSK